MPTFTGTSFSAFYKRILQVSDALNQGISASLKKIESGDGASTSVSVSDDAVLVQPNTDDTTTTFEIKTQSGTSILSSDTTNKRIKVGSEAVDATTQLAVFGITAGAGQSALAGYHYPLAFCGSSYNNATNLPDFGNGTDPATSFTTANANTDRASDLACMMFYVYKDITIDSIVSIEGADAATGDTTRLHLFSYDLTSGSTSALSNGTLLAHTADTTNAGSEQLYKSTWTIDSANVAEGKVIMCFFEQDSVNSDISYNVQMRYHIQ